MNKLSSIALITVASFTLCACSLPSWMGGKKEEKPKLVGERIAVLPDNAALKVDPTLKDAPINLPAALPNDTWPEQGGALKAESGNLAMGGNFDVVSHARIGEGEAFIDALIPSPVVGGSMVYAMDELDNISAHDVLDVDHVRWKYSGAAQEDVSLVIGGGLAYDQGKLYALSGRGVVAALDAATGKEIWRKELHLPFRSAPKVADGKLFAITMDNQTYALNLSDGSVAWTHRGISEAAGLLNSVSPTIEGDMVVVPYSSGEVYVLSASDGKEVWTESVSAGSGAKAKAAFSAIGGDPLVDGGVVFSVSSSGSIKVQALAGGQHVWDRPIGAVNTPWMSGDNLFVLSNDNTLVCFVKFNGKIRWATQLQTYADLEKKKEPITWRGPVMVDSKLALVGSNGQLVLVSAEDGKIVATKEIPENIYTAPVIASGRMFLVGQDATLYSLK